MSASPLPQNPPSSTPPKNNVIQFPPNRTKYWESYAPRARPPSAPPLPKLPSKVPFGGIGKILGGPVKSIVFDELFFTQPAAVADLTAIMPQSSSETIQSPSLPFNNGQSPQIPYLVNFRFRRTGSGAIDTSWTNGQARVIGPISKIQVFVGPDPGNPKNTLHVLTIFAGGGVLLGRDYDPTGKSKVYEWIVNWPTVDYEIISIVREDGRPDTGPPAPPPDPLINPLSDNRYPGNPDNLIRNPGDRSAPISTPKSAPNTPRLPSPGLGGNFTPAPNPDSIPSANPTSPTPITSPNPNSSPTPNTGTPPNPNPKAPTLNGPWTNPGPSQEGKLDPPNLPNYFSPNPIIPQPPFQPTPVTNNPPARNPISPNNPIPNPVPGTGTPFKPTGPDRAPTPQPPATPTPQPPRELPPTKDPFEEFKEQLKPLIDNAQFIPAIAAQTAPEALRNAAEIGTCRSFQPGGCNANIANNITANGNKLDQTNALLNAGNLTLLGPIYQNSVQTISRLGPQINGGLSGGLGRLSKFLGIDRALNLINFIANLHNAFMLSNQLKITLLEMLSSVGNATGLLQTSENENVDLNAVFNAGVNSLMNTVLGEENYASLQVAWRKYNRIYQAAVNSTRAVSNMMNSLGNAIEVSTEYTGKIGNSLRAAGMVAENAYQWMSEKVNAKMSKFITFESRVNDTIQVLELINEIAENVVEGQEAATEFQKANTEFIKAVEDAKKNPGTENKAVKEQMAKNRENATKDPTGEDEEGLLSFLTDL